MVTVLWVLKRLVYSSLVVLSLLEKPFNKPLRGSKIEHLNKPAHNTVTMSENLYKELKGLAFGWPRLKLRSS